MVINGSKWGCAGSLTPPSVLPWNWPHLANVRRSSGFWAAGTLRMAARSCSDRLASRLSVILLFSGESPLGRSSALELSMLGLVRVMSSLLAVGGHGSRSSRPPGHPTAQPPPNQCRQGRALGRLGPGNEPEARGPASAWGIATPKPSGLSSSQPQGPEAWQQAAAFGGTLWPPRLFQEVIVTVTVSSQALGQTFQLL